MLAIEVAGLGKTYCSTFGLRRHRALKSISLAVESGQIVSLLGPNGAGKTTLVKILLGLLRPSSGTARIAGECAGSIRSRIRVGYLPENLRIESHHTADSALIYWGRLNHLSRTQSRIRRAELLETVGLTAWASVPVRQFSKGMRQRLGLAGAMLHDPDILILDEPTDGLDPAGRKQVRDLLFDAKNNGKTVFLNSHLLQEVEQISDQIAILDHGELKFFGPQSAIQIGDSLKVEFELRGAETEARAALDLYGDVGWQPLGGRHYRVLLELDNQAAIDQCIDGLRAGGISIVGLRYAYSLEDAFLELVQPALLESTREEV
jgi:ABC-2 type transport system ATP-binding protein